MDKKRPFYHEYAWAYDLLVDSNTYKQLSFIKTIVSLHLLPQPLQVLDAGCGTGSLAIALAGDGHQVTAIDLSEPLLEEAKRKNTNEQNLTFVTVNILELETSNTYDLIVCRGVLNDFTLDEQREKLFSIFHKALRPNGLLVADVRDWEATQQRKTEKPLYKKKVKTNKGTLTFTSVTHLNPTSQTLEISESHRLETKKGTFDSDSFFVMKCWNLNEIVQYSQKVKFSVENLLGGYDINTKKGETDRIVFVLKKL